MIEARDFRSPDDLALHLSKYVTCPSTIVAGTANHFGKDRAVSFKKAVALVQKRRKQQEKAKSVAEHKCRESDKFDHLPFKPAAIGDALIVREVPPPVVVEAKPEVKAPHRPKGLWPSWYRPIERKMFPRELIRTVAEDAGYSYELLAGPSREGRLIAVRAVCYRILRDRGLSFPQIGRFMGDRDHTAVMAVLNRFDYYRDRYDVNDLYERHREAPCAL